MTRDRSILGFHSRDETAMLVYKTIEKCRSSFKLRVLMTLFSVNISWTV